MVKKLGILSGLSVLVILAVLLSPVSVRVEPVERTNASAETIPPDNCPDGSYSIGYDKDGKNHICKLEPTGCPYGDSIPLEYCDKFAPENQNNESTEGNNVEDNSEVRDSRSTESKEEQSVGCTSSK